MSDLEKVGERRAACDLKDELDQLDDCLRVVAMLMVPIEDLDAVIERDEAATCFSFLVRETAWYDRLGPEKFAACVDAASLLLVPGADINGGSQKNVAVLLGYLAERYGDTHRRFAELVMERGAWDPPPNIPSYAKVPAGTGPAGGAA